VACVILRPEGTLALGNVTLTVGGFSDPDGEDTHHATQWVIRDSSANVFDSGTDTTNLLSIAVDASYFTLGNTYYWKARFQDQHLAWGPYSSEQSFTYGIAPTATPTVTDTITQTPSSSVTPFTTTTVTTTVINSATATVTVTITVNPSLTVTISPTTTISPNSTPYPPITSSPTINGGGNGGDGFDNDSGGFGGTGNNDGNNNDNGGAYSLFGINPIIPNVLFIFTALASAAAAGSGIPVTPFLSQVVTYSNRFFRLIPWRRRKTKWGYVYDSISKKPISGAQVRIYSEPDGKLRQTQYSAEDGSLGFIVPAGQYSLAVAKDGYDFPCTFLHGNVDGVYENIYYGGEVTIGEEANGQTSLAPTASEAKAIFDSSSSANAEGNSPANQSSNFKLNIPLDANKAGVANLAVADIAMTIEKVFDLIRFPILILGTILTLYLVVRFHHTADIILLGIYGFIWLYDLYTLFKPKTYGRVTDSRGKGLEAAVIRVLDGAGKIIGTVITSADGKFGLNQIRGTISLDAAKIGYQRARTGLIDINRPEDLGKVQLTLDRIGRVGRSKF